MGRCYLSDKTMQYFNENESFTGWVDQKARDFGVGAYLMRKRCGISLCSAIVVSDSPRINQARECILFLGEL